MTHLPCDCDECEAARASTRSPDTQVAALGVRLGELADRWGGWERSLSRQLAGLQRRVEQLEADRDGAKQQAEPDDGTIAVDKRGRAWQRIAGVWFLVGAEQTQSWAALEYAYGPVTLLWPPLMQARRG